MDSHDNAQGVSRSATTSPADPAPLAKSRGRSYKGIVLALTGLAVLGGLSWYLTHPSGAGGAARPGGPGGPGGRGAPATTVGVATAERADIPVVLEALGSVTAAATVTVRPQVSGVLQQILYREGQMVKAGQVLAVIDPSQFQMSLMQATGQRQRDEAQLENARLTLKRYRTLLEQDSIARQDVDTQDALVKQLEGTVLTDRAAEGTARLNLGYTKVIAPVSGRVGLRVVDTGNVVSSGDAGGVAVITQISPIDVEFSIPQDQVPEVQARTMGAYANSADMQGAQAAQVAEQPAGRHRSSDGDKAGAKGDRRGKGGSDEKAGKDDKGDVKLAPLAVTALDRARVNTLGEGRFLALDNQVDAQTGTVKAKARFPNDKLNLFPSQFVNVKLLLHTIKNTVVVPVTALRHGSKGDFVYVLNTEDRTVALRPVTRGQATVEKVEITTGLQPGEKVITEGADRLKDGARVTLPGERGAGKGGAGGAGSADSASGNGKGKRGRPDSASGAAAVPASNASAAGASGTASGEPRHRRQQEASPQ
ncbi:efflux RND transporter periplasmic adaptor subunit [Undibacterium sp.]|uniref:efflux RND transporter periplasmic adaptor subunit n=1 Tax=Undibacterium sp. TaxID=1914977 RepID=UPI002C8C6A94|nr:efflux RND transporter periplasmic adaptor subunit [Undibacterium sp.]HTD05189.1 efflux RND transporter periplasmic adaptor subunit [Undibacterium sp.]